MALREDDKETWGLKEQSQETRERRRREPRQGFPSALDEDIELKGGNEPFGFSLDKTNRKKPKRGAPHIATVAL